MAPQRRLPSLLSAFCFLQNPPRQNSLTPESQNQIAPHDVEKVVIPGAHVVNPKCLCALKTETRVALNAKEVCGPFQGCFHLAAVSSSINKILTEIELDLFHSVWPPPTCMVIDTLAPVGDPHFSSAYSVILFFHYPRHASFSFSHLSFFSPIFFPLPPLTASWLPSALPCLHLLRSSHLTLCIAKKMCTSSLLPSNYLLVLIVIVVPHLTVSLLSPQQADEALHNVRTLLEHEAALAEVLHAQRHPGGVPVHEGPGPLQHQ